MISRQILSNSKRHHLSIKLINLSVLAKIYKGLVNGLTDQWTMAKLHSSEIKFANFWIALCATTVTFQHRFWRFGLKENTCTFLGNTSCMGWKWRQVCYRIVCRCFVLSQIQVQSRTHLYYEGILTFTIACIMNLTQSFLWLTINCLNVQARAGKWVMISDRDNKTWVELYGLSTPTRRLQTK